MAISFDRHHPGRRSPTAQGPPSGHRRSREGSAVWPTLKGEPVAPRFNKDVRVEWEKRDKYKRIVGKVWVQPASCPTCPMTLDAGHAQITVGMAWWYRKYGTEQSAQDRGAYEFSEQEARAKRAGLWADG
jgi:hypothetical protein